MFLIYVAVAATPCVIEDPAFKVAVTGAVIAPMRPDPKPLKNPFTPSSFDF